MGRLADTNPKLKHKHLVGRLADTSPKGQTLRGVVSRNKYKRQTLTGAVSGHKPQSTNTKWNGKRTQTPKHKH